MARSGNGFLTNLNFDRFTDLLEMFSTQLVGKFKESFFFVPYHFVMGLYGHIPVKQTYKMEMQALTDSLAFG